MFSTYVLGDDFHFLMQVCKPAVRLERYKPSLLVHRALIQGDRKPVAAVLWDMFPCNSAFLQLLILMLIFSEGTGKFDVRDLNICTQ